MGMDRREGRDLRDGEGDLNRRSRRERSSPQIRAKDRKDAKVLCRLQIIGKPGERILHAEGKGNGRKRTQRTQR